MLAFFIEHVNLELDVAISKKLHHALAVFAPCFDEYGHLVRANKLFNPGDLRVCERFVG